MRDTVSLAETRYLLKEFEIVKKYHYCVIIQYYVVIWLVYVTSPWRSLRFPISWICDSTRFDQSVILITSMKWCFQKKKGTTHRYLPDVLLIINKIISDFIELLIDDIV